MSKSTHSSTPAKPAKQYVAPGHSLNTTDATRGEPIAVRAQKRRAELEKALLTLPENDVARPTVELALAAVAELLPEDVEQLSHVTIEALNRWLESNKHVAEVAKPVRFRT